MGQAKRRGTFEQRKSRVTQSQLEAAIDGGVLKHYAFVIDRSARGRQVIDALRTGPEEMRARINHPVFNQWEASQYEFLVIWGSFGYTGGLTLLARDVDELVNAALPAVVDRIHEKDDGLCSFMFGVSPDIAQSLQDKVAELQAAVGNVTINPSTYHAADSTGMLDLATAKTGREVDMDFVQILDQKAFDEVSNVMMRYAAMMLSQDKEIGSTDFKVSGWVQEDGRLTVECNFPGAKRLIEVAKGQWRELTPAMYREAVEGISARTDPQELSELVGSMAEQLVSVNSAQKRQREEMNHLMEGAEQGLMLFDRSANSLAALKSFADQAGYFRGSADNWLASDEQIYILSIGANAEANWNTSIKEADFDMETLLAELIEHSINPSATVLTCTFGTFEYRQHLNDVWRQLGGKAL
ncbi:hypothetical protein [Thiobacillus denitrificans]|uniref:hypothetical protein n=1 Tax=Thiobacillus denitrificans TaxID=36861 RepID=UPI000370F0FE|nr:hypothetical protein [Thiobacillus denitrificans]